MYTVLRNQDMDKIKQSEWLDFILEADCYNGPRTIGELFCDMFEIDDKEIKIADNDSVWQLIVNKYR